MKPAAWLLLLIVAILAVFAGLSPARVPATVAPMPTVAKKTPARKKEVSMRKPAPAKPAPVKLAAWEKRLMEKSGPDIGPMGL